MSERYGFELLEEREIPELRTHAFWYRHKKTGAQLLSLVNDDENKSFGITFRTPPADSTGLPHIMEHAVLCGSQRFPVKEPFVELMKGSLHTFLNAFTYPDRTCYPVASQNLADFYNLIDVYVDAVFFPLNSAETLDQEGWHYELEDVNRQITFKGIVFNEMKGAYSSPENLMSRYCQALLFPDTPYRFDSGGDPQVIPNLSYDQFKDFHATYYHPSNAFIFFYGDDPVEERLQRIDAYLSGFSKRQIDSSLPLQPRFIKPTRHFISYPSGQEPDSQKGLLTINWLLDDGEDPQRVLALRILNYILIGTPASALRKALIDSGLGEDLVGDGLDTDLRQLYFSTGLKGLQVDEQGQVIQAEAVEELVFRTLAHLVREGIDPEAIAAAINTIEFRLRENNTGGFPRGLALMLRSLTAWLYERNPITPLAFDTPLSQVKASLVENGRYFEELIQKGWLENPHKVVVILQPDPGLSHKQEMEESKRLSDTQSKLSEAELQELVDNTQRLKRRQETPDSPEALATIPSLTLEDLSKHNKLIPLEIKELGGAPLLFHDIFTNGILYFDIGFDLHALPQELLPYIPLFSRALTEMGTQTQDFVQLSQRIGRSTGGIWSTILSAARVTPKGAAAWMFLRGKATVPQAGEFFAILQDILITTQLDNSNRFHQMVLEEKADLESSLVPGGRRVVNVRLAACLDEAAWLSEELGGINYLFFVRKLVEQVEKDWPSVLANLQTIQEKLIRRGCMVCNITLDADNLSAITPAAQEFLDALPEGESESVRWTPDFEVQDEGLVVPTQVNFVGKGANLYQLGHRFSGALQVILNFLRTTWLWEKVRVQGGAYGGMCTFDHRSGVFSFLSYRDPNLALTLKVYDQTASFLSALDQSRLSPEELTKNIIGVIGDMDAYQLPDAKGFTSLVRYLTGDGEDLRQIRREQVLSTKLEDFHNFAATLEKVNRHGRIVVMGSHEALEAANQILERPLKITKIQ